MTLETRYGVPTVAVHTDKFDRVVRSVAQVNGMPGLRQVFVPQPIMGRAPAELRAFAKRFGIPVVTSLLGIGAVDTTSELSLRMLGMHGTAYTNYAVEDCDFLFAVGARFDDRVADKVKEFAPHAKIAHLDVDARGLLDVREDGVGVAGIADRGGRE